MAASADPPSGQEPGKVTSSVMGSDFCCIGATWKLPSVFINTMLCRCGASSVASVEVQLLFRAAENEAVAADAAVVRQVWSPQTNEPGGDRGSDPDGTRA